MEHGGLFFEGSSSCFRFFFLLFLFLLLCLDLLFKLGVLSKLERERERERERDESTAWIRAHGIPHLLCFSLKECLSSSNSLCGNITRVGDGFQPLYLQGTIPGLLEDQHELHKNKEPLLAQYLSVQCNPDFRFCTCMAGKICWVQFSQMHTQAKS